MQTTLERKNIVGGGDIASVLPEQDRLLFFASGVSNSRETRPEAFKREQDLLESFIPQNLDPDQMHPHIVYFGSLSVFYTSTPYTRHKLHMESIVKTKFPRHTIVRLGNIAWGTNPNTIINAFRQKLAQGEPIEVQDAYRYVVDKEEFLHWINLIPDFSCEMNVPGTRMHVSAILEAVRKGTL